MCLQGFPVATVTFYDTKMTESFSAIIGVLYAGADPGFDEGGLG